MSSFLKPFVVVLLLFLILDFLWFRFVVRDFNLKELSEIGRIKDGKFDLLMVPAIATYILMTLSIVLFVIPRISDNDSWLIAFASGSAMGLIVYGIFDLTNLAIMKNYPIRFLIVDMIWGTVSFGIVSVLSSFFKLNH